MSKRLTIRHPHPYEDFITIKETKQLPDTEQSRKVLSRLCELEDKIEQGKLVELPFEVGQTVYLIAVKRPCFACWGCSDWCHKDCQYTNKNDLVVKEATVEKIELEKNWVRIKFYVKETNSTINSHDDWRNLSDFGKTVFLERAAAESKLREMEGERE